MKRIQVPLRFDQKAKVFESNTVHREQVTQMMTQLVLTSPGERVNRPDFGCEARRMLFMPINDATRALVKASVFHSVQRWMGEFVEPRNVRVESVNSLVVITVEYRLLATGTSEFLNIEMGPGGSY